MRRPDMVRWDVDRSPMSVQLLVRLGADHDLPAQVCLESTGLEEESLRDTAATVSARQQLTVIANLVRALGYPPGLGLEAGIRYHLTTYGIWGFAMISSPTWAHRDRDQRCEQFRLVLDTPDIPPALQGFVVGRDSAAIQTIQHEVFASPIHIQEVSYTFSAPAFGRAAVRRDLRRRAVLRRAGVR